MTSSTLTKLAKNPSFKVGIVYFYIVFSGLLAFIDAAKQMDYLGMAFGLFAVVAVFILYRVLKKMRSARD